MGRHRTLYVVVSAREGSVFTSMVKRSPGLWFTYSPKKPLFGYLPATDTRVPFGVRTCTATGVFGSQRIT